MGQYTNLFASFFGGAILSWLGHALYIRPRQLTIKSKLPTVVKSALQRTIDNVVPQLTTMADAEAVKLVNGLITKVAPTGK